MEVYFRAGHINLQNPEEFDAIVCPTDRFCSGEKGFDRIIHQAAGQGLKDALHKTSLLFTELRVTPGFELDTDFIVHVAVPHFSEVAEENNALQRCYMNVLSTLGRTDIACQHPKTAAITFLGTGPKGWPYEYDMICLWHAILEYHKQYGSYGSLKKLFVYYPSDIKASLLDRYTQRASRAFFSRPEEWGPRLGRGLWYALMEHFDNPKFNNISIKEFIHEVQRFYHGKTGKWLCGDTCESVPEWAVKCSGVINEAFAKIVIPVLCSNLCKLGFPANQDSVSFVLPVNLSGYQLSLPYEILSDLTDLRKSASELTAKESILLLPGRPYYLTKYHYLNAPDMVEHYCLDVEKASDSHYNFSAEAAADICRQLGYMPNAIAAALGSYMKDKGELALEIMVQKYATEVFHY